MTVPCATCGGTKRVSQKTKIGGGSVIVGGKCQACDGTGVTRTPVTCAGCKWWNVPVYQIQDGYGRCYPLEIRTKDDWGCKLWTAKEATDGNG